MNSKKTRKKSTVKVEEDVVMADEARGDDEAPPPSSAPEKEWARVVGDGSLFNGFARRSKSDSPAYRRLILPSTCLPSSPLPPVVPLLSPSVSDGGQKGARALGLL
ncbi:hypothetical protein NMY22_g19288 [Coprinellus aureogranulatus]|nr:hypothetical protein NMY22_g19288 [Coprinellus aureogranulatus]